MELLARPAATFRISLLSMHPFARKWAAGLLVVICPLALLRGWCTSAERIFFRILDLERYSSTCSRFRPTPTSFTMTQRIKAFVILCDVHSYVSGCIFDISMSGKGQEKG